MSRGHEANTHAPAHDVDTATRASSTLTLAMRAARKTSGPRALRVARVEGGRIVDERLVRAGGEVTVGTDPSSTFIVDAAATCVCATLFAFRAGRWHFAAEPRVRAGLELRVASADAAPTDGAPLPDDVRGRVVLGDTSFLFQLVEPPARSISRLPRALLGSLGARIDFRFTTVAAFSFLAHFGAAVAMHGDGLDVYVDDEAETASFLNAVRERPTPPVIEAPPVDPTTPSTTPARVVAKQPKARDDVRTPSPHVRAPSDPAPSLTSEARAELLAKRAEALEAMMLGTPEGARPATGSTLRPGYAPGASELDRRALEAGAVDVHAPRLKLGTPGDPNAPPSPSLDGTPDRRVVEQKPREDKPLAPPPPHAIKPIQPVVQDAVRPPDFDTQIAANKWRFRGCYARARRQPRRRRDGARDGVDQRRRGGDLGHRERLEPVLAGQLHRLVAAVDLLQGIGAAVGGEPLDRARVRQVAREPASSHEPQPCDADAPRDARVVSFARLCVCAFAIVEAPPGHRGRAGASSGRPAGLHANACGGRPLVLPGAIGHAFATPHPHPHMPAAAPREETRSEVGGDEGARSGPRVIAHRVGLRTSPRG
jgi:hypothetical protein